MEPLVWNETTGNLVGGHQRLSLIDQREKFPLNDYQIDVSVVTLSPHYERRLNIWLNNPHAQGTFEKQGFFALLKEFSLDDLGFNRIDLEFEFGELPDFLFKEEGQLVREQKSAEEAAKELQEIKDKRNKMADIGRARPEQDISYYIAVHFNSSAHKRQWMAERGLDPDVPSISYPEFSKAVRLRAA